MPRLPAEPTLVGRDQEIGQLMLHLDSALNGKGNTLFIYGEAGIGKTRLANEFLKLAKKRGAKIFSGWCLSEANIPYFPFREAFDTYVSAMSDEKSKSTVTKYLKITGWLSGRELALESKPRGFFSTPEIERDRTFEAAARVLLQLSVQETLIVFLDDLHWADPLSLALLHYLSKKCRNARLLIIGTYRSEELIHTKVEKLHPLEETMISMSREDLLTKIELHRLKRDDFPELLRSIFRSSLTDEFEERFFEETEGNPLFAIEMLKMLVDEGYVSRKDGRWILAGPIEKIRIPSRVHEVIIRRVRRLERKERRLLDLAAVCGYSFTPDTLSEALSLDLANVLQGLVELERRHRLIRSVDSAFEFTHHKIREVVYGNLPSELRRIYHLKIARCLEQILTKKVSEGYMADMALHSIEGGALEKAFDYLLKLGEKAVDMGANVQAIEYLDRALEIAQKTPSLTTGENLAKIYKFRGRACLGRGEVAKAVDDFKLLLQNAASFGNESVLAESYYWLGEAQTKLYRIGESKRNLLRAIEMARKTGNRHLECRSLASLGWSLIWSIDTLEECRMRLEESSTISKEIGDKIAYARSRFWLAFFYNWRGEFNLARESIDEALPLLEELGDRFYVLHALGVLGWINCGKGEYNDAISAIKRCLQLAQKWGIVYWDRAPMPLLQLGWIHRDLSNIELALQYDSEALENAKRSIEKAGATEAALVDLGMDFLSRSDYQNAEKHFKEADHAAHSGAEWRIEIRRVLGFAEIALAKGDFQNALESAENLLVISKKAGAKKYIAKSWKLKAEVLAKIGNIEEAIALMEDALNVAQQVGNPPLLWQIHHSLGLLEEENGDTRNAGEHYTKAITIIEAVASQLNDVVLKSTLLTSPETRAVRDAIDRSMPGVTDRLVGSNGFDVAKIVASISVPNEFVPSEEFEVRLDVANVGKKPGLLVRIDDLVPRRCKVMKLPSYCALEGSSLNMTGRRLEPLSVESISVSIQIADVVGISVSPQVTYIDELGNFRTIRVDEAKILPVVEFESKAAQHVFNYLVDTFVEDCVKRKLGAEKSGWRSFPQIIKGAGVSKRSLYGTGGRLGHGLSELQRKGLVDLEIFVGERGRGGHILRVRVHHTKESVKRYIKERGLTF